MKKLFLSIALIAFISSISISVYANRNFSSFLKCEKCEKGKDHKCGDKCEKDCKESCCNKKDKKSCDKKASCTSKEKENAKDGKKCAAKAPCMHSSKDSIPSH